MKLRGELPPLAPTELRLLAALRRRRGFVGTGELTQLVQRDRRTVSWMLDRLEERGRVERDVVVHWRRRRGSAEAGWRLLRGGR